MEYLRYGENGIRIVFGDRIDPVINEKVRRYYVYLKSLDLKEIVDIIPSFMSCLIRFNSETISFEKLVSYLTEKESCISAFDIPEPTVHEIPVVYGGEDGPDMEFVVSYTKLSEDEVIDLHTSTVYTVYTIGFMPGFPYLGSLDKRLYVPRLETPRVKVPKGSVGLAQLQTGIYTYESPGGWQVIGKTEARLFDHTTEPYCLMKMGDRVRFIRV
jgi:KipI family sensor histidine kinase inhibitor